MSDDDEFDERVWAAERRDFVADWRDGIAADREADADARESTADEREQRADDREADLEELEQRLDVRAVELGLPPMRTPAEREGAAAQRVQAAVSCDGAREERQRLAVGRERCIRPGRGSDATGGNDADDAVGGGLR